MNSIIHRKIGLRVEFDFYLGNGILGAHKEFHKIKWESIVCVIGYPKPIKIFQNNYGISIGFKDKDLNLTYYEVLSTDSEWEYRYFLEKTVLYLKKKFSAIGGESWCSIFEDKKIANYYNSYILCRSLADNQQAIWFEQDDHDHINVANDFINKVLAIDGTEASQVWNAIEKTRFKANKDGSFDIVGTLGHQILYNQLLEKQSKDKANQ